MYCILTISTYRYGKSNEHFAHNSNNRGESQLRQCYKTYVNALVNAVSDNLSFLCLHKSLGNT